MDPTLSPTMPDIARVRVPRLGPARAVCWLLALGILRNALEIACGVSFDGHWFSWAPDIVWSMAWFPFFLCFYGALALWLVARALRIHLVFQDVVALTFAYQTVHLLIPFVDWLGNVQLGIPKIFYLAPFVPHPFYTTIVVMTSGILTAWLVAGWMAWRWLHVSHGVARWKAAVVVVGAFQLLFWPVYIFFPTFNTLFAWATGTPLLSGQFFGYGTFFILAGIPGFILWSHDAHSTIAYPDR